MASIVDQIIQGVVQKDYNYALNFLANLLGEKLVFNTGTNDSVLGYLSAALSPVYLGVLFAIMAYIGVGGTAKTAMDGEFLGRNWHSVGVPAFLITCIMLLSPVPNQNGITLGQVIFVKSVVIGSNFGDFVLKTAVQQMSNSNQQAALASSDPAESARTHAQIKDVSNRMLSYLKIYSCSMQYSINGGVYDDGYLVQLASLCGVPGDAVSIYKPYFKGTTLDSSGNAVPLTTTSVTLGSSPAAKEYKCMFDSFESFRTTKPSSQSVSSSGGVIKNDFPITIPTDAGSFKVGSRAQVKLNTDAMLGLWPAAVIQTRGCIYNTQNTTNSQTNIQQTTLDPWGQGWALAAAVTSDKLMPNANIDSSATNPEIKSPQPSNLPNTGSDALTKMHISTLIRQIDEASASIDSQMSNLAVLAADASGNGVQGTMMAYTDAARTGAAAVAVGSLVGASNLGSSPAGGVANPRLNARKFANGIFKVWGDVPGGSVLKSSANLQANALGSTLRAFKGAANGMLMAVIAKSEAAALAKELSDVQIMGFKGVGLLAKGLKAAGKAVGKAVKVGAAVLFSIPGLATGVAYAIIFLNIISLAPEITLAIALILWLMQVASWFLMVPIATLIIAIPNTRVGHSSWRSALALALTPGVIMLFYILSLVMYDIILEVSTYTIFLPYIQASANGSYGAIALRILEDIFTGEMVFRLFAYIGLLAIGFFFTLTLVLRGPRWFFAKVGLDSNMDEFGSELSEGMHGKMKMGMKQMF